MKKNIVTIIALVMSISLVYSQDILDKPIYQQEAHIEEVNGVIYNPYSFDGVVTSNNVDMNNFRQCNEKIGVFQKFEDLFKGYGIDNTCECGATSSDSNNPNVPPCSCEKWKWNNGKGWVHTKNGQKCTCTGHHHDDDDPHGLPLEGLGITEIIIVVILFIIFCGVRIYKVLNPERKVVSPKRKSREEMKSIIDELDLTGKSAIDIFEDAYDIGYEDGLEDANIDIDD